VDYFYSQFLRKVIEGVCFSMLCNPFGLLAGKLFFFKARVGDIKQGLLRKMTDQPRVRAVLKDSRWSLFSPL
jgi:hypothetical protein